MKRSLFAVTLAILVGSESISATPDSDQKNVLSQNTAAFAAHSIVSLGLGYVTITKSIDLGRSIPGEYRELRYLGAKTYSTHKKTKELATFHKLLPRVVEEHLKNRNPLTYSGFLKQLLDYNNQEIHASCCYASLDTITTRKNLKIFGSTFLKHNTNRLVTLAVCGYGTYWFGKNAYNQIGQSKKQ